MYMNLNSLLQSPGLMILYVRWIKIILLTLVLSHNPLKCLDYIWGERTRRSSTCVTTRSFTNQRYNAWCFMGLHCTVVTPWRLSERLNKEAKRKNNSRLFEVRIRMGEAQADFFCTEEKASWGVCGTDLCNKCVSECSMAGSTHSHLIYRGPENNRKQGSEACTEVRGETPRRVLRPLIVPPASQEEQNHAEWRANKKEVEGETCVKKRKAKKLL